mmetsp:Transcript_71524/g.118899  ORF Transcript_71524/g.118899 Transcript_71524/m.118899 type:complete len:139 (+) Transcript_71524:215-631(+)
MVLFGFAAEARSDGVLRLAMAKQQAISIHVLQAAKLAGFIEKLPPAQPRARWSICSQLVCTLHPLLLQRRNRNAAAAGGDAFIISFGTPSSLPATNLTSDMTSGWTFAVVLCLVRILGFLAAKVRVEFAAAGKLCKRS